MSNYDPKKGKKYINESLEEQQPVAQTTNATPPTNQQPQQNQAQIDANFEKEVDSALSQIMKELPQQVQQIAKTQGDKDGQLEPIGQQNQQPAAQQQTPVAEQELSEAILPLVAGAGLALPAITNLVGKSLSFLGSKTDNQTIQSIGQKVSHVGEHLHHKYLDVLKGILSPYIGSLPPKTQEGVVNGIFYALVAALGAAGVAGATHAVHGGNIGLASVEGGLSTVKASELISAARSIIPKILSQVVS